MKMHHFAKNIWQGFNHGVSISKQEDLSLENCEIKDRLTTCSMAPFLAFWFEWPRIFQCVLFLAHSSSVTFCT